MVVSYLGLSDPLEAVNEAVLNHIVSYRKANNGLSTILEIGGIYDTNLRVAANFAAKYEIAVYTRLEDFIKRSDAIFVFLPDNMLKKFCNTLKAAKVKNKIICHFNPGYNADVLDLGEENTYVSFYIPSFRKCSDGKSKPDIVFVEGYGKDFANIEIIMNLLDFKFCMMSEIEKELYLTAANFLNDFPKHIENVAHRLMKIALHGNPSVAEEIFNNYKDNQILINSYDPVATSNSGFLTKQYDVISKMGISDIASLFAAFILSENYCYGMDFAAQMKIERMCRKLLKRD